MDLKGSLVDTHLKIYPKNTLIDFLKSLQVTDDMPVNILKLAEREVKEPKETKLSSVQLTIKDFENLSRIKTFVKSKTVNIDNLENNYATKENHNKCEDEINKSEGKVDKSKEKLAKSENQVNKIEENENQSEEKVNQSEKKVSQPEETVTTSEKNLNDECTKNENTEKENNKTEEKKERINEATENLTNEKDTEGKTLKKNSKEELEVTVKEDKKYLTTSDIDWLYTYLQKRKGDANCPHLHELLEGCSIEMPDNKVIKRNPVLEARCVKLRAQQEAREYRKMTKTVDNVRLRFPEDSISYQLKQLNRQLIAIGQFILSIFAGFLFGFRGIEWMVGNLEFGFRLLLGVMCALVIALAEIYFLAKKLNEELNIPETVQLGGPPKFVNEPNHVYEKPNVTKVTDKEHQD